jgi:hypothetical protein
MRRGSMTAQRWLACAVIASGMTGVGLALADARMPPRTSVVLAFFATAPTMAVAGLLRGLDA